MFDPTSRYYNLEVATLETAGGRTISYVRRRLLPRGDQLALLGQTTVAQGERIDIVANRTLGDPQAYWRIADANDAVDPVQLTAVAGRVLNVPLPQGPDR
jgi:hypothetical protein